MEGGAQSVFKQSNDNMSTNPYSQDEAVHNLKYNFDPEYKSNYDYQVWADSVDKPLEDQTLKLALFLNGLQPFTSYGFLPTHAAGRVSRAIQHKDPSRLIGAPNIKELKSAFSSSGPQRNKLLWRGTANGTKLQDINRQSNQ